MGNNSADIEYSLNGSPVEAARAFVRSVAWGGHTSLWAMLSSRAQRRVLGVAIRGGMKPSVARSLYQGSATKHQFDSFLGDLLLGLRSDFNEAELEDLIFEIESGSSNECSDREARIVVSVPLVAEVLGEGLPIAYVILSREEGSWLVDEVVPVRSGYQMRNDPLMDAAEDRELVDLLGVAFPLADSLGPSWSSIAIRPNYSKRENIEHPIRPEVNDTQAAGNDLSGPIQLQMPRRHHPPIRRLQFAVSAEAMALAWAHQERSVHGGTLLVENELGAYNRLGEPWIFPQRDTLTVAVILQPKLDLSVADALWTVSGLGVLEGLERSISSSLGPQWPDLIVANSDCRPVCQLRLMVEGDQGRVKNTVVTIRVHINESEHLDRESVLDGILSALDRRTRNLNLGRSNLELLAREYNRRFNQVGSWVRVMLKQGRERRGILRGVSWDGNIELESVTGLVQVLSLDSIHRIQAV